MKYSNKRLPKPGTRVIITTELPDRYLGLSESRQTAIAEILGKPVLLVDYDADGRAELEFRDRNKSIHFIYVDPIYIKAAK
jgi:hypothetical protein